MAYPHQKSVALIRTLDAGPNHRMVYPHQKSVALIHTPVLGNPIEERHHHRLDENLKTNHKTVYPHQKSVALIRTLALENLTEEPRHHRLDANLNCLRWMVEMNHRLDVGPNHKMVSRQKSVAWIRTLVLGNLIEEPHHHKPDAILNCLRWMVEMNRTLDVGPNHKMVYPRQKSVALIHTLALENLTEEPHHHRLDVGNPMMNHMMVYPRQKIVALIHTLALESLIEELHHHRLDANPMMNHKTVYPRQKSVAWIRTLVLENLIEEPHHHRLDANPMMNHRMDENLNCLRWMVEMNHTLDVGPNHRMVYPHQKSVALIRTLDENPMMSRTLDVGNPMMNHKTVYPHQKSVALIRTLALENLTEELRHHTLDENLKTNHRMDVGRIRHPPLSVWAHVFPNDSLWHSA